MLCFVIPEKKREHTVTHNMTTPQLIAEFSKDHNHIPIVSIECGCGDIEWDALKINPSIDWKCVSSDNLNRFTFKIQIQIVARDVDELMVKYPTLKNNCAVFIGRYPDWFWLDPKIQLTFDHRAVEKLNPKYVIVYKNCSFKLNGKLCAEYKATEQQGIYEKFFV